MNEKLLDEILLKYSKKKDVSIPDNINLIEYLSIDSVDAMRILVDIEDQFGIELDIKDINMSIFESKSNLKKCIRNRILF
ncbi:MAG: acyl carrier protein [Lachnospiraceae bacterium]|nr:acyl carrier protein [Lachnospiraceae bacterium]